MKPPSGAETDQYRYLTFNIHQAAVPQGFSHLHQDDTGDHRTTPADVGAGHKFGHTGHKIRHSAILVFFVVGHELSLPWEDKISAGRPKLVLVCQLTVGVQTKSPAFSLLSEFSAGTGCIPLLPIRVSFSAQISAALARQVALIAPDGTRAPPKITLVTRSYLSSFQDRSRN